MVSVAKNPHITLAEILRIVLNQLTIDNFTIASHVELEFLPGMTAITGETGAGKSISLDALALTLGDRADSKAVRHGAERAEINAIFDLGKLPAARQWLEQRDLERDMECILRRVITREGRSRAYINGQPATLQDLKTLGEMLIDIHSQHEHQSLLKKETHRALLDAYANAGELALGVQKQSKKWHETRQTLNRLTTKSQEQTAHAQLLSYQLEEFATLNLGENELEELELEQKLLANADHIIINSQQVMNLLSDGESGGIIETLSHAANLLNSISGQGKHLDEASQLLTSAHIQADEARQELQSHIDSFEANPERLAEVESRLSEIYQIARKHKVAPEQLTLTHQALAQELEELLGCDEKIASLQLELDELTSQYQQLALSLSKKRHSATKKLTKAVTEQLKALGMNNCQFEVALTARQQHDCPTHGLESVEFLIATNVGQPAQPLAKIASGGELSRISLAIQVVTAKTSTIPTLIFDEVDVGIGGGTAEVVGNLLRQLGKSGQVICVTHQPQVAAKANQHFRVSKLVQKGQTLTRVETLQNTDKVDEIARMLGGLEITERTIAHAREMLALED
jgi:DNA repair protein RecN (Recombination protein N)